MSYDEQKFALIIDQILRESDLNTIGAKRIRKNLAARLGYDISEYNDKVVALIERRFDKIHEETLGASTTVDQNTHSTTNGTSDTATSPRPSPTSSPTKRSADDSDLSDVIDSPKPKKKRAKTSAEEDDAAFAARLQAEENSRSRPTRGGGTKKKAPVKKQKKKSAAKVKDDGDAASGSEVEPQRKGGFHVSSSLAFFTCILQLTMPETHGIISATFGAAGRNSIVQTSNCQEDLGICQGSRPARPERQTTDSL